MGGVTYVSLGIFSSIFNLETLYGILMQGLISGIIGIISGMIVLALFKNKEFYGIVNVLSHKLHHGGHLVAPEQADL